MMKRFIKILGGIAPFGAALGIQIVVGSIVAFVYSFAIGLSVGFEMAAEGILDQAEIAKVIEERIQQSSNLTLIVSLVGSLACGILFFFWYRKLIRGETRIKKRSVFTVKNTATIILLGIGGQFFITAILSLIQPYLEKLFSDYAETMEQLTGGSLILVILYTVVIAPIVEELIFRGVILKKTSRAIPFLGANLVQAALFGVYHLNWIQGIYAFCLGMILGIVYHKFKTIFAPILLHMIVNTSAFLVAAFPVNLLILVVMLIVGLAFVVISLVIIRNAKEPAIAVTMEGIILKYE